MKTFFDYSIRKTRDADIGLALLWTSLAIRAPFWLEQNETQVESFLVFHYDTRRRHKLPEPVAFFKIEHVGAGDQVRFHFQAGPEVSPKIILKGLAKLVPLIEKALARRGVKAIFFTSHSESMACFMADRFGYHYAGDGKTDGVIMAKGIR